MTESDWDAFAAEQDAVAAERWDSCERCGGGKGWLEDVPDDERYVGFGSCERCGCDLDSDHPGDLCDQCEWWLEHADV